MNDSPAVSRPTVFDCFAYSGFHGCRSICDLELITLSDGRTVAIVTERADNPGTSITNIAEHLASWVCNQFQIDPDRLVWIEHYGFASTPIAERTFDLVKFSRLPAGRMAWSMPPGETLLRQTPAHFHRPRWRTMTDPDWHDLDLPPRYE